MDREKVKRLLQLVETVVPYVTASIDPKGGNAFEGDQAGWVLVHEGRAGSSVQQLNELRRLAKDLTECAGKHEWTPICPEDGEPPLATWFWCIRCGCLKLGDEEHDPTFSPGPHQKKVIVQDK